MIQHGRSSLLASGQEKGMLATEMLFPTMQTVVDAPNRGLATLLSELST